MVLLYPASVQSLLWLCSLPVAEISFRNTFCLNNTESNLTIEMHVTSMVKHAMNLQSVFIGNATVYDLPSYRRYRLQHWHY